MTMANSLPQFEGTAWKNSVFKREHVKKTLTDQDDFDSGMDEIEKDERRYAEQVSL